MVVPHGNTKHGHSRGGRLSRTYSSWNAMMYRCFDKKSKSYKYYGAKGIIVCERWCTFQNFLDDMGARPEGMTLHRLDNTRGYEPGNCVWADRQTQTQNQRKRGQGG